MATREDCDDDVPPLEDCTELLDKMKMSGTLQEKTMSATNLENTPYHDNQCNNLGTKTPHNKSDLKQKKPETFGGFQKGFLSKPLPRKKPQKTITEQKNTTENVPLIKAKNPTTNSDPLAIPEVQEAMKTQSPLLQNADWLNNDLMQKLQDNPDLLRKLLDPKCQKAINTIQADPKKGQELLAGDKDLQDLFKELSSVLGDHFTGLAQQETKKLASTPGISSTDEQAMGKILSDKDVVEALKDPWISKLVANLKNNPEEARRMLAKMKPEYLSKVHKLVKAGILSYGG